MNEVGNFTSKFLHCDGGVVDDVVDDGRLDVYLVDLLGSVVVLNALYLSLNDWLNLLDYVLVDMLSNDRSIHRCGVSLVSDCLLVRVGTLGLVSGRVFFSDILVNVSGYVRSNVLMVGVMFLLVENWLYFLVNFNLVSLSVDDWGDFVVSMLENILVNDGIEDVSRVGSTNLVIYSVL